MEKFIHRENIRLYRKLLAETTDPEKRQMLLKLLADEEAKDEQPPEEKQG
jgi:rubrerythrin